jgi:DNA replication factor GINS
MNIDELRSAQSKERQKSDLQQLRESFYGDVAAYVEELEAERERAAERAEDPFGSPEVQQLTNDIETAKDTAEAIYERRLGKIVKKASLVSAEMANPNDVNGLTAEEQALFSDLVERIEENKAHMLDVIAGDAPPGARDDAAASGGDASASGEAGSRANADAASANADVPEEPPVDEGARDPDGADRVSAADLMGGDDAPADGDASDHEATDRGATDREDPTGRETPTGREPASSDGRAADASGATDADGDDERATLRVTENVGEIFGVDEREYTLAAEDVVTLPEENADVLVSQGAAERLD